MSTVHVYAFLTVLAASSSFCAIVHDYYWRDFVPGSLLFDAFEGVAGRYIGQVHSPESLLPATVFPFNSSAVSLGYNGKTLVVQKHIKILCAPDISKFYWETVDFKVPYNSQLTDAVRGGFQKDSYLFIGRVVDNAEWKIGQVFPFDHLSRGVWVWNKFGISVRYHEFEILKYNSTLVEVRCNNFP